jgi:hypothetical protein
VFDLGVISYLSKHDAICDSIRICGR